MKLTPKSLKKVIDQCFFKHTPKSEHKNLFKELGDLLGLYQYVIDNDNITPYIIIDSYNDKK